MHTCIPTYPHTRTPPYLHTCTPAHTCIPAYRVLSGVSVANHSTEPCAERAAIQRPVGRAEPGIDSRSHGSFFHGHIGARRRRTPRANKESETEPAACLVLRHSPTALTLFAASAPSLGARPSAWLATEKRTAPGRAERCSEHGREPGADGGAERSTDHRAERGTVGRAVAGGHLCNMATCATKSEVVRNSVSDAAGSGRVCLMGCCSG